MSIIFTFSIPDENKAEFEVNPFFYSKCLFALGIHLSLSRFAGEHSQPNIPADLGQQFQYLQWGRRQLLETIQKVAHITFTSTQPGYLQSLSPKPQFQIV